MTSAARHVVLVGIDGVRFDTLAEVGTPRLDALAARGFLRPVWVNDVAPTISGPSWSTIMTGTLARDHGVFGNDFSTNRYAEHPDIVEEARRQRPELDSWVAAGWLPLVTADSGGPLFQGGGWHPDGPQAHTVAEWHRVDDEVAERTAEFLRGHDGSGGSLAVAYLGGVDETAHLLGVGTEYREFIAASDHRLGAILDAVADRTADEEWTVIVVTDHGHVEAGGHGGDSVAERTAWIAAAGPGVPTGSSTPLEQSDVAAHILATLGLRPTSPAFVGRPFG